MVDSGPGLEPGAFGVDIHRAGTSVHVAVSGDLDMASAPQLRSAIERALADGVTQLALDLRSLRFMGSSGIALCCRVDDLAREEGFDLAIVRGPPSIQRIFDIAGVADRLRFVDTPPLEHAR